MGGIEMIDGITLQTRIDDFEIWKELTLIQFSNPINIDTGEMRTKKREDQIVTIFNGKWETFELKVTEVRYIKTDSKVYYLKIKGSLHKNHFNGKNFQSFNWIDLQTQVQYICKTLLIDPNKAEISTIEVGVNIVTPFNVTTFLKANVIDYKGKQFKRYKADRNGVELGLFCELKQYQVKLYDKGLQNNLENNLMRFEKRFRRMQILKNKGVIYLSDLLDIQKVKKLKPLIVDGWKNVLIYDIENSKGLNKALGPDYDLVLKGKNPRYWEEIKSVKRDRYYYQRVKFKNIVLKNGSNYHSIVLDLLEKEWESLINNSTNLPIGKSAELHNLTFKIKGKITKPISKYCIPCIWDCPSIIAYN